MKSEATADNTGLFTQFAPAERASPEVVAQQAAFIKSLQHLTILLDTVPNYVMVLNRQRQIIFANKAVWLAVQAPGSDALIGFRPGEIFQCIHANRLPGGCGTTEACAFCGAIQAVLKSLRGQEIVREARITLQSGRSLDLQVWASLLEFGDELFVAVTMRDISHEKRRLALERVFLHDVLNTVTSLYGYASLLQDADEGEAETAREMIGWLSARLVDEIQAQQDLAAAENNEIAVRPVQLNSLEILREAKSFHATHETARNCTIDITPLAEEIEFTSDPRLLGRVISNMVKNALEASPSGDTVTLDCRMVEGDIVFSVHNSAYVPRNVQMQVFQRSFSTKGEGRGLGTYSMRLLSERYLGGKVSFTTSEEGGTTFTARYPMALP